MFLRTLLAGVMIAAGAQMADAANPHAVLRARLAAKAVQAKAARAAVRARLAAKVDRVQLRLQAKLDRVQARLAARKPALAGVVAFYRALFSRRLSRSLR